MVCMIPLLAVHPKQDIDSHEDCNHIELAASQETGNAITKHLDNNNKEDGNIRIPDEVVTLKLILPFTKEPQDVTLAVYDGIAYFQGDIQIGRIDELKKKSLEKGFGIKVTGNKWTNGIIYYSMDFAFSPLQRANIRWAMDHIGRETNLCFEERSPANANYIYFNLIAEGDPNAQGIGMIGGQQNVNLLANTPPGVIVHEILHIAGLHHEHSRPDRDDYIIVNDGKNGTPDYIINQPHIDASYVKIPEGGPYQNHGDYDYGSIMHYQPGQGACYKNAVRTYCDIDDVNAIIILLTS